MSVGNSLAKAPTSCITLEPGFTTIVNVGNLLASVPSSVITREFHGARPYECAKSMKSFRQTVTSFDNAEFVFEKSFIRAMNMGHLLTTNSTSFNNSSHWRKASSFGVRTQEENFCERAIYLN